MVKKVIKAKKTPTPDPSNKTRVGHVSIFKRTDGDGADGIGFFSSTRKHFHDKNGFRAGGTSALIIATAVQHGFIQTLLRIQASRAVRGTPSSTILSEEEVRAAMTDAANAGELMYLLNIPPTSMPDMHDASHEKMLVQRTRRAEIATLKREKARAAKADAQEAVAGKPVVRSVKKMKK